MKKDRLLEIIYNFPKVKVLVVGDIMIDHFIYGNVTRISPEAPVPVVNVEREETLLGGSANVINNINSIGGGVIGVGVIGTDIESNLVNGQFVGKKLDINGIIQDPNRKTTLKTRIVAHNQQVVRFDKETKKDIDNGTIKRIIRFIDTIKEEISCIVVSDYNKGVVTEKLLDYLIRLSQELDIPICVDPKKSDFDIFEYSTILTPNLMEASSAVGFDINDFNISKAGHDLLYKYNLKSILITQGEKGMTLFERNGEIVENKYLPTEAKSVYDVTGAGDTVIAILSLAIASGASYKEASVLSNLAAGIVVGKVGTSTVSKEELVNMIINKYKE